VFSIGGVRPYAAFFVVDDTPHGVHQVRMTEDQQTGTPVGTNSVVLLREEGWPAWPGVCCWRASVHAAFTGAGLEVREIPWSPPVRERPEQVRRDIPPPSRLTPEQSTAVLALQFMGRVARAGVVAAGRRVRAAAGRVGREFEARVAERVPRSAPPPSRPQATVGPASEADPRLRGLTRARLVLAESPEAALAAVRSGVPAGVVWLLAIPPERAAPGEPVTWAGPLREAVPEIGGLVTDSLDAAGVLERVAGPVRTVVLPPIASDRACPTCGGGTRSARTLSEAGDLSAEGGLSALDVHPTDVPSHLRLWRRLLDEVVDGSAPTPTEYSWAVARLRGEAGPWLPPRRDAWGGPPDLTTGEPAPDWSASAQAAGVQRLLATLPPAADQVPVGASPLRVRVFGYDMKFMRDLARVLGERPDFDLVVDEWRSAGAKNDGITENLARSAQTLVAEWARPNAVWLSKVKRPDQHLVVRLHRFEIDSAYPRQIDIDAVDAVVYIAPHMGRRIRDELGWPAEKLVYIPNYTDLANLDRPKYPDARFTLGMVGIVPSLKRFDLALDLLAAIRREDPRFSLLVRSQMGWAHPPSWESAEERRQVQRALARVEKEPLLRGAVVFDAFGRDMGAWFRKVGHVLSLSDVEGSHVALCEGMASGAVPVIRGWEGAAEAYGVENISASLDDAVAKVLESADPAVWERRSRQAKEEVARRFDPAQVVEAWVDLSYGHVEKARQRFAAYVDEVLRRAP
jgi:glycosyltransferase involved in cell wall biosynthesis